MGATTSSPVLRAMISSSNACWACIASRRLLSLPSREPRHPVVADFDVHDLVRVVEVEGALPIGVAEVAAHVDEGGEEVHGEPFAAAMHRGHAVDHVEPTAGVPVLA